jgi:cysteine-rich repeat protein
MMAAAPFRSLTLLGALALACSSNSAPGTAMASSDDTQGAGDSMGSTSAGDSSGAGATEASSSDDTSASDATSTSGKGESGDGSDESSTGAAAICGDGIVADSEPCDDGNDAKNDGCTPACELQRVVQISTGGWHTCAILDTGALRCWGNAPMHGHPEIWDSIGDDETPASVGDVTLDGTPTQIVNGERHVCALLATGNVRCWGESPSGELGYGDTATLSSPGGDLELGGVVTQLAAGLHHTCALFDDATMRCWGGGGAGQLGQSATANIGDDETPAEVDVIDVGDDVVQIAAGGAHTCALVEGGDVRCWGRGIEGSLGYGNTDFIGDDEPPSQRGTVLVGGVVTQISASLGATCALLEGGTVRCWGRMEGAALGYPGFGTIGDDELPAEVGDVDIGEDVVQVSVGAFQICALLDTGNVRCWGYGAWGNLGYGWVEPIGDDETPASVGDVPLGGEVALLDANGYGHACAVIADGGLRCWGYDGVGQLGQPSVFPAAIGDNETPDAIGYVEVF